MAIDLVARLSLDDQMSGPLAAINSKMMGMVGFAAVAAGATNAVKSFADFESQVRKATVIAGGSDKEFNQMAEGIKNMSSETSISATKIAAGMTELASAGMNTTDALAAMPGILTAAKASAEDLAVTSDVVTSALSIWGLEAEESARIADILAQAANETKLGIADMGMALKYAGAPAKALGMSLEEVSAAAGIVVNAGIDSSTAGTSLRAGLLSLSAPTKAAAVAMSKYGFSAVDANGNVKSMVDIVDNLKGSMEGMTAAQQAAYLKTLVGTESYSAFMSLIDAGPEKLSKLQKSFENSEGASKKAADEMSKGLGAALQAAKTSLELFKYDVGDALAPAVETFARFIAETDFSPMIEKINSLASVVSSVATVVVNNFDTIATAVKWAAAAFIAFKSINVIIGVVNTVITVINAGIRVFKALKTAVTIVRTAFTILRLSMLLFPGAWLIAAIGAVIAAGVLLYKNWDTVKAKAAQLWAKLKDTSAFKALAAAFNGVKDAATYAMSQARIAVTDAVNGIVNKVNWLIEKLNAIPGVNVPLVAHVKYETSGSVDTKVAKVTNSGSAGSNSVNGPHAIGNHGGWNEIRTDGTLRNLHAGERVLTAVENDGYKQMMSSGLPNAIAKIASLNPLSISSASTSNTTNMNNVDNRMTSSVSNTTNAYSTTNDSVTKNYTTGAFELPAFNEVPILNAIRNLSSANGTAPVQESFKLDVTDIVTAIERMAKRAINVVVPQDGSANAVEQLRDIIAGNQPTLTATETQAVSNSVQNSSFSESVSNVTTTNNSKKTTTQTIQPVVNLGGVHIDSKWDLDTMAGREQVAKKIALPITQEIAGLLKLYV